MIKMCIDLVPTPTLQLHVMLDLVTGQDLKIKHVPVFELESALDIVPILAYESKRKIEFLSIPVNQFILIVLDDDLFFPP